MPDDLHTVIGSSQLSLPCRSRGFSLIELTVVIIIVGVLSAIALPRFIDMGRDARVASLKGLMGTLWSAANQVHSACALSPSCDVGIIQMNAVLDGRWVDLDYGYPEAGDNLNGSQIDSWIAYTGFTASIPSIWLTQFTLDGAPDPQNCRVDYTQANSTGTGLPGITATTTGC